MLETAANQYVQQLDREAQAQELGKLENQPAVVREWEKMAGNQHLTIGPDTTVRLFQDGGQVYVMAGQGVESFANLREAIRVFGKSEKFRAVLRQLRDQQEPVVQGGGGE